MDKVIIVEGKNDYSRLKQLNKNLNIITTNGSAIDLEKLKQIKNLSETNEIVLLLDPDYPGEKIRKKIMDFVPSSSHIFIPKKYAISKNKRKVGVEHVELEILKNYLDKDIKKSDTVSDITFEDLYEFGLIGKDNSKSKREILCNSLNIGYTNSKQLLNRLKLFGINKDQVIKELNKNDWKYK